MTRAVSGSAPPSPYLTAPDARRFAPVGGPVPWGVRTGTQTDPVSADVLLAARPGGAADVTWRAGGAEPETAGLAFDRDDCLYRGDPARGQIQRIPWPGRGAAVDLLGAARPAGEPSGPGVGFTAAGADPARPLRARALAADRDDHLFVLDGAAGRVAVLDLADGHLLRTIALPAVPVDLAATGGRAVYALTASRTRPLVRLDAIGPPVLPALDPRAAAVLAPRPGPATTWPLPPAARPARVAVAPDGGVWILLRDGDDGYLLRALPGSGPDAVDVLRVPFARDLELDGQGRLVVAGPPGDRLRTWSVTADGLVPGGALRARGYDGRGLVRTPDGRIGYFTGTALGIAVAERVRYVTTGTVGTPDLDGLAYGLQWGRIFVEACVPPDTTLRFVAQTTDEPPVGEAALDVLEPRPLHRRETGRELAWAPMATGDRFEVYEAPIVAPPGRYLRLRLTLTGTGSATPRIRALRAEIPGRDLITKLPRTYRRDPVSADLLRRFLAVIDGQLGEIESRAVHRDLLLDPYGAPPELLPWLASLIGLTLDTRWPEPARRTLLAEAVALFRRRGTVAGLQRVLEIYLGAPVVILESFRLRGRAAPIGGPQGDPELFDAVLGGDWRVAGGPGSTATPPESPSSRPTAHRFTVLLTSVPDDEQLAVVRDLLDLHRPAHTLVEVCSIGGGMRVGMNLHVQISSLVGAGSGFSPLRVGGPSPGAELGSLGRDGIVGQGRAGIRPGGSELGRGTVIDG